MNPFECTVSLIIIIIILITCNQVMHSHYQSLGGWSFELVGYWEEQMMAFLNEPEMTEILTQVDINSELQFKLSVTFPSSFDLSARHCVKKVEVNY